MYFFRENFLTIILSTHKKCGKPISHPFLYTLPLALSITNSSCPTKTRLINLTQSLDQPNCRTKKKNNRLALIKVSHFGQRRFSTSHLILSFSGTTTH